jgi:rRNA-processing protein FCF1
MARLNDVLIDTNILIYMYENKKDIFEECKLVIPNANFYVLDKVLEELSKVYKTKPGKLRLIKRYLDKLKDVNKFKILNVDESILKLSPKFAKIDNLLIYYSDKYLVYTNDKILKEKIKLRRNKVLILKLNGVLLI